jgi:hypothetical protein
MLLLNEPVPVPLLAMESDVVGFAFALHTTPRAVTLEFPSEITFPPESAPVCVMPVTVTSVTVGTVTVGGVTVFWPPPPPPQPETTVNRKARNMNRENTPDPDVIVYPRLDSNDWT